MIWSRCLGRKDTKLIVKKLLVLAERQTSTVLPPKLPESAWIHEKEWLKLKSNTTTPRCSDGWKTMAFTSWFSMHLLLQLVHQRRFWETVGYGESGDWRQLGFFQQNTLWLNGSCTVIKRVSWFFFCEAYWWTTSQRKKNTIGGTINQKVAGSDGQNRWTWPVDPGCCNKWVTWWFHSTSLHLWG